MGGEIDFLDQKHFRPAHGGVAGDRRAVDSAADDEEVEGVHAFLYVIPAKAGIHTAFVSPKRDGPQLSLG